MPPPIPPQPIHPFQDHDAFWKEALDLFLPEAIALFLPDLHAAIDWERGYRSLDGELLPDETDDATGRRYPDRVYEVHLKTGETVALLIHFEVQSRPEAGFALRMFVYRVRLFLKYRHPIVSIAILADRDPGFRPTEYRDQAFGNDLRFRYHTIKLRDFLARIEELEDLENVFGFVVTLRLVDLLDLTDEERYRRKRALLRKLVTKQVGRERLLALTRLLAGSIMLPQNLKARFRDDIRKVATENDMPFMTPYEIDALEKGRAEGRTEGRTEGLVQAKRDDIVRILRIRFGGVPATVASRIAAIDDLASLDRLLERAVVVRELGELDFGG